jgi:pyrroloquinoline quinone biosynthesis protein E
VSGPGTIAPPLGLLAELTHRCPMRCAYCSNPLALEPSSRELDTITWCRVFSEAADLGVLQVHFSGGEPAARKDLEALVGHAATAGLYTNLITSGFLVSRERLERLAEVGLEHVQISIQDVDDREGDRIGGLDGAQARKRDVARWVIDCGLALTINAVVQRSNAERVGEMISLAHHLGAGRIEVAHVQYYGWALANRSALLPTREQLEETTAAVAQARARLKGDLVIDYVVPDYHARLPKACMGGWGRRFLNVDPRGRVLPCHAAATIPGLAFETVHDRPLGEIWASGEAFNRYRGTGWMREPCASCDRRAEDWGGCRCQALALTGDAGNADPVCHKSPFHDDLVRLVARETGGAEGARPARRPRLRYRGTKDLLGAETGRVATTPEGPCCAS